MRAAGVQGGEGFSGTRVIAGDMIALANELVLPKGGPQFG